MEAVRTPAMELKAVQQFSDEVSGENFLMLENGNYGMYLPIEVEGLDVVFEFLIEYHPDYPNKYPKVWLQNPVPPENCPHILRRDAVGDSEICYLAPKDWKPSYDSAFVAQRIMEWVVGYIFFTGTGSWFAEEGDIEDYLDPRNLSVLTEVAKGKLDNAL